MLGFDNVTNKLSFILLFFVFVALFFLVLVLAPCVFLPSGPSDLLTHFPPCP